MTNAWWIVIVAAAVGAYHIGYSYGYRAARTYLDRELDDLHRWQKNEIAEIRRLVGLHDR